jgi:hypothetical protein
LALLPVIVERTTVPVPDSRIAPPSPVFPENVEFATVSVPPGSSKIPPPSDAELLENVEFSTSSMPRLSIPPPRVARLPEIVEFSTVSVPPAAFAMPPPLAKGPEAELLEIVEFETVSVALFVIPPPSPKVAPFWIVRPESVTTGGTNAFVPSTVTTMSLSPPSSTAVAWPGHWAIVSEIRTVTLSSTVPATATVSPGSAWFTAYWTCAQGFDGSVQSLAVSSPLLETYLVRPVAAVAPVTNATSAPAAQISRHRASKRCAPHARRRSLPAALSMPTPISASDATSVSDRQQPRRWILTFRARTARPPGGRRR